MNADDSVITCNMEIPYVAHTLKKIPLSSTTFNEFTPKFYDDKNEVLGFFSDIISLSLSLTHSLSTSLSFALTGFSYPQ